MLPRICFKFGQMLSPTWTLTKNLLLKKDVSAARSVAALPARSLTMAGSQEIDTTKGPLAGLLVLYKMSGSDSCNSDGGL